MKLHLVRRGAVGLTVAAFCVVASFATIAQTAVAPAVDNSVALKPWIEFVQPYLTATATVIVPILIAALAQRLSAWLGVSMNSTQVARLKSAAATEAGALIAQESDNLSKAVIKVSDPRVVAAANAIASKLPATAAAVGATPEALAKMVQGEIGKLQAAAPSTTDAAT
jgi:hypothetical protein